MIGYEELNKNDSIYYCDHNISGATFNTGLGILTYLTCLSDRRGLTTYDCVVEMRMCLVEMCIFDAYGMHERPN